MTRSPLAAGLAERRPSDALRASGRELAEADLELLEKTLEKLGRIVVAFSGGADSAFLAYVATCVLGRERAHCITALSASLAPEEHADCAALAKEWGLNWSVVTTDELARPAYGLNDLDRCYHCKSELMDALEPLALAEGATVVLGVNVDDLGEHRPGQRAASERGATFPLVDAGLEKSRIRELSDRLGLRTWDKPAAACLASRVPHGTAVTAELLGQIARAESGLRRLGFRELRVRHYGDAARLELGMAELARALECREQIVEAVKAAGYRYVTLDLEGLRSGNLSRAAAETAQNAPRGSSGDVMSATTTAVALRKVER
ncbi:MAG: ExsB family protein [Acidimicrobiaceae bacterium]|nr:ExsB family protein [Acidimicrobiaceae bacterium]